MLIVLVILALAAGTVRIGFNNLTPIQANSEEHNHIFELSSRAILTLESQMLQKNDGQPAANSGFDNSVENHQLATDGAIIFAPNGGVYIRD